MRERFHIRNRYILAIDLLLIFMAVVLSYLLRLEFLQVIYDYLFNVGVMLLIALPLKPLIYRWFGLYQRFWAYASAREMVTITLAVTTASAVVGGIMYLLNGLQVFTYFARSVPIIDWMLSLILVGGVRFMPRFFAEGVFSRRMASGGGQVLIVGAGDAGALVVRELQKNPQLKLSPIAYLDDDEEKQGVRIHGVPVVGRLDDLGEQIDTQPISEVIIAIPSAPGQVIRQVAEVCRQRQMQFRTMPGIYELLGGAVSVSRLREVDITDLLRRELTDIDDELVAKTPGGKRILITGAGGSIASELCRQISRWGPAEMVLVGHGENSIFEIIVEMEESFPGIPMHPVIADIRQKERLELVFQRFKPQVVFHAAAHKHVPLMEKNVEEAVTNNILGTHHVVDVARAFKVERLVMISTDKAVRPTSVMGATKRLAEMIVLDAANHSGECFSIVRFGNVLGSRGSVVPMFRRQIAVGGPVTVTHPDMERYFMTIPEAVHLVLQAFAMGSGGEVFLLNMGEPVRVLDLAEDLIRLSGLEPGQDVEIVFTGMRPGEKMSEVLWDEGAAYHPTDHPEITRLDEEELLSGDVLSQTLEQLVKFAHQGEVEKVVEILDEVIPGSDIRGTPPPDLTSLL
jgi:FlaA1/EpsC-like NDP-sugar epimerase